MEKVEKVDDKVKNNKELEEKINKIYGRVTFLWVLQIIGLALIGLYLVGALIVIIIIAVTGASSFL